MGNVEPSRFINLLQEPPKNKNKVAKDQLISEWLFDVLNFPKSKAKIWQISAQEFKKGQAIR